VDIFLINKTNKKKKKKNINKKYLNYSNLLYIYSSIYLCFLLFFYLVYIGGEAALSNTSIATGEIVENAQIHNGALLALEHR
jgi:hypothetical protein